MNRVLLILRALVSRRWLPATLFVLLGMALLARLGIWQLDRLEQRRALNAELQSALEAPPLALGSDDLPANLEALKDRGVVVQGKFDFERQIILKLQNWNGRPGVHLVTPFIIDGTDRAVLVDRGWIPISESSADNWSPFDEPETVTVNGYISLSQSLSRPANDGIERDALQREWYRIDIEAIQSQMPFPLLPFYISQAPSSGGEGELPYREEREIDLSEGPHLGYAIQWFSFSLMLAIIYIAYLNKHLTASPYDTSVRAEGSKLDNALVDRHETS